MPKYQFYFEDRGGKPAVRKQRASSSKKNTVKKTVCRFYNTARGCRKGSQCGFIHLDPDEQKTGSKPNATNDPTLTKNPLASDTSPPTPPAAECELIDALCPSSTDSPISTPPCPPAAVGHGNGEQMQMHYPYNPGPPSGHGIPSAGHPYMPMYYPPLPPQPVPVHEQLLIPHPFIPHPAMYPHAYFGQLQPPSSGPGQ